MTAPVRRRRPRAGKQLRAELEAALARASRELPGDDSLEWSEQERLIIDRAAAAADRGEQLGRIYSERLAEDAEPGVLVKLSAKIRACERQAVDLVDRVSVGPGPAKSERHQRAVRARWDCRDAAWAAARDGVNSGA